MLPQAAQDEALLDQVSTLGDVGDDDDVIHSLASRGLRDMLFAYNGDLVKGEGGGTTWYEG